MLFPTALILAGLSLGAKAQADELTVYAYPSAGINWDTPAKLVASTFYGATVGAPFTSHKIGHMNVELRCGNDAPLYAGMTTDGDSEEQDLVFREEYGLGVLFHSFRGRLELESEIAPDLPGRYKSGKIAFIHYQIRPETCERVRTYLTEYRDRGYDRHYGFPNRPRYGEGGGCSAFALSVLEVAGLKRAEFAYQWTQSIRVPLDLIGGPLTSNRVPATEILFSSRDWATFFEPHRQLDFWDPDLVFAWIQSNHEIPYAEFVSEKRGRALGLSLDATRVPTPTEPIWKQ